MQAVSVKLSDESPATTFTDEQEEEDNGAARKRERAHNILSLESLGASFIQQLLPGVYFCNLTAC